MSARKLWTPENEAVADRLLQESQARARLRYPNCDLGPSVSLKELPVELRFGWVDRAYRETNDK